MRKRARIKNGLTNMIDRIINTTYFIFSKKIYCRPGSHNLLKFQTNSEKKRVKSKGDKPVTKTRALYFSWSPVPGL